LTLTKVHKGYIIEAGIYVFLAMRLGGMVIVAETEKKVFDTPDTFLDNNLDKKEVINEYIAGRKKKELCDQLKKGYKEMAAVNLEWAENCLDADNQCQLDYEEKLSECE